MHPADIASALKKAGQSASSIARELGVSHVSVSRVVSGISRSQRIEERISEITDIPLYRLWPDWHSAPEGRKLPKEPGFLDYELLEAVVRGLEDELRILDSGMPTIPRIRIRHLADCYNQCLKVGPKATETEAGTREQVREFLNDWVAGYERFNAEKPTPEAIRKWALYPGDRVDESVRLSANTRKAAIVNEGTTVTAPITLTGENQTLVLGNKIKKQVVNNKG